MEAAAILGNGTAHERCDQEEGPISASFFMFHIEEKVKYRPIF